MTLFDEVALDAIRQICGGRPSGAATAASSRAKAATVSTHMPLGRLESSSRRGPPTNLEDVAGRSEPDDQVRDRLCGLAGVAICAGTNIGHLMP